MNRSTPTANGAMVRPRCTRRACSRDEGWPVFAVKSLERVLLACYKPGGGVAHYFDGQPQFGDCLPIRSRWRRRASTIRSHRERGIRNDGGGARALRGARDVDEEPAGSSIARRRTIGATRWVARPADEAVCDQLRRRAALRRLARTSRATMIFAASATARSSAMAPLAVEQGPLAAHYLLAVRPAAGR